MSIMRLRRPEKELFVAVEHGDKKEFENNDRIRAEVLRHIVLGLPLIRKGVRPIYTEVACKATGAGISITGAVIEGPVRLDAAIGAEGGPIHPLAFHDCVFEGGFSASHAHVSRLSFCNCTFLPWAGSPDCPVACPVPILDLTGARLDGDLDLRDVGPDGGDGCFRIGAPGIEVRGGIDLSGCELRAPPSATGNSPSSRPDAALDLNLAKIAGDFTLTNGTIVGGVRLRSGQIGGDMWLSGAVIANGAQKDALFMQGTRIGGFLMMNASDDRRGKRGFECDGNLNLTAAEIGLGLQLDGPGAAVRGDIKGPDLAVKLDVFLWPTVGGFVDLRDARIGGTLDISELQVGFDGAGGNIDSELLLWGATVGRTLRVACHAPSANEDETPADEEAPAEREAPPPVGFQMTGDIDLSAMSCGALEDDLGVAWGKNVRIKMNHFTYRQTGLPARPEKKRSNEIVGDWLLGRKAEGLLPWRLIWRRLLPKREDFWEPWQLRRNWIYQQFDSPEVHAARANPMVSISRHEIEGSEYRPQPFEQAIRVARAEGREDFANHFEAIKQGIEWRLFNRMARWGLAIVAIILAALWLTIKRPTAPSIGWTLVSLALTIFLMVNSSRIYEALKSEDDPKPEEGSTRRNRHLVARGFTWLIFFIPAGMLYFHAGWNHEPFHFLTAVVIFLTIRLISVCAHAIMRFGFGYMRRPVQAIGTLLGAFLLGWWGTHVANVNEMLVVDAEPVAGFAAPAAPGQREAFLIGSQNLIGLDQIVQDVDCLPTVSEPLYALDVLIPLLDLREESRCEVRRGAAEGRAPPRPEEMRGLSGVVADLPRVTIENPAFWMIMKALYAIAGWFIVSLSILTFAQVNRTRGEPTGS